MEEEFKLKMFRIIVLYFTAAGLAGLLSNCTVSGQVTSPDGRQNQSVCTYTLEGSNLTIRSEMELNKEKCLTLDSVEVHVFNKSTNVRQRLVTCLTFGDWPRKSTGVVNKPSRRTFGLKYVSLKCARHNLNTSSTHFVVHSELKVVIGDQMAMKQLPFIFVIKLICRDSHGSTFRYPAACPIVYDMRENQTESLITTSTDYPSTAGPVSQSLDNLTTSENSTLEKEENVSDAKKKTDRRLGWYLVIPIAIIVNALFRLGMIIASRRSKSKILASQDLDV